MDSEKHFEGIPFSLRLIHSTHTRLNSEIKGKNVAGAILQITLSCDFHLLLPTGSLYIQGQPSDGSGRHSGRLSCVSFVCC